MMPQTLEVIWPEQEAKKSVWLIVVRLFSIVLSLTLFWGAFYLHTLKLSSWRLRKISCIVLYCSYL